MDIPAAGVASASNHDWILSNALCNFETKAGYVAYDLVSNNIK